MRIFYVYILLLFPVIYQSITINQSRAQETSAKWERSESLTTLDLQLFHSLRSINLPTAETLQRGDMEFEISHRFSNKVSDGIDSFYGLDGPANIRFGISFALTDHLLFTLGRSNYYDNVDFFMKYKFLQLKNNYIPVLVAWKGGLAWNTQVYIREKKDSKNFQYFSQIIINTLIREKIGLGIVPSYMYNSDIFSTNNEYSLTLGNYAQYYISPLWSVLIEWNPTVSGYRSKHNSVSFGIELETGGHFFKLILSNNSLLNTSQFLLGTDSEFTNDDLFFGFNITRILSF